ncbi:MAG TPA: aldo/keto reductase [Methylobacterium sp.]|jgi:diketogulonate reductase-like aldo/keto reductase|nr:aldo/keto reductase [Methylobacterium sp.]
MSKSVPLLRLNNGVEIPALGLGVYLSPPEQTAPAVQVALASGYRLIDTAAVYGNEQQVGEGIARGEVARTDLFVTTKLWIADFGYDEALRAFDVSMGKLGLEYLDLYLLHWPAPKDFEKTVAAYKAAERLLAEGRVRAIGVCNFNPNHLDDLAARTEVTPALNQVELHPMFDQRAVREANAKRGIVNQSWSPIGGTFLNHPKDPNAVVRLLDHPAIVGLAKAHGKTPAQVVLRWHVQHGLSAIPKSVQPDRIAANIDIFDFELSDAEMATLDGLGSSGRGGPDPEVFDLEFMRARAAAAEKA